MHNLHIGEALVYFWYICHSPKQCLSILHKHPGDAVGPRADRTFIPYSISHLSDLKMSDFENIDVLVSYFKTAQCSIAVSGVWHSQSNQVTSQKAKQLLIVKSGDSFNNRLCSLLGDALLQTLQERDESGLGDKNFPCCFCMRVVQNAKVGQEIPSH